MCVFYTVLVEIEELSGITSLSDVSSGDGGEAIKFSDHTFTRWAISPHLFLNFVGVLGT